MTSLIQATLGLDTTDFQTKAKAAEKDLKGFAEGVGNISKVFTGAGTLTAVTSFFDMVVSAARESKDSLNENVQAVRRFGDSMDEAKSWARSFSVTVVGSLNQVGESIGETARGMFEFVRGNYDGWKQSERALRESEDALADTQKRLKEMNDTLKERQSIDRQLEAIAEKKLTNEERISYWLDKHQEAQEKLRSGNLTLIEQKRTELELAQTAQKYEEARAAFDKETMERMKQKLAEIAKDVEREKKVAEEREKIEKDRAVTADLIARYAAEDEARRRSTLTIEEQIRLAQNDLLKTRRLLASFSGDEKDKQELITRQHEQQSTLLELTKQQENARAEAAAATAEEQMRVTEELAEQARQAKTLSTFKLQGPDYSTASNAEIKDWISQMSGKIKSGIKDLQANYGQQSVPVITPDGRRISQFESLTQESGFAKQIKEAEAALAERERFVSYQNKKGVKFSEDDLARMFGGYQRVESLSRLTSERDSSTRIADTLETIDKRLKRAGLNN